MSLCLWVGVPAAGHALRQAKPPQAVPPKPGQQPPPKPGAQLGAIPIDTPKPPPAGAIRGRITSFTDGKPLSRARVILSRPDQETNWVTITDDQGRYELTELDAFDNYMLAVSKSGYAPRLWGEKQLPEPATPIKITDGQKLENVDVALAQHLWVSGKILDSDGTPFAGGIVSALRPVFVGDRREMVTVAEIITNDKGEYRLFGLPAGQYFISAVDPAFLATRDHLGPLVYAATFYPGVPSPEDATRITLEPGQPRDNIDFPLRIVKPARVSGKISPWNNEQLFSGAVVMSPFRADRAASFSLTDVDIKPDGTYEFANVPSGRFIIRSRGETDEEGITMFAAFTIGVVERNLTAVDMTLYPGARIQGLVEWHGATPRPTSLPETRVRAPMHDGSQFGDALTGHIKDDNSFLIRGAMVGGHLLRVENLPFPWSVKSVFYRGQDVTDIPISYEFNQLVTGIRIVLTDSTTKLAGRLVSTADDDFESYKVVMFPVSQLHWKPGSRHIKLVRPDREGRYSFVGLPPTVYYLVASRDVDESDIGDMSVLERLAAGALTVRLNEGEQKLQDLRTRRSTRGTGAAAPYALSR
ncbi:MAG: carboxypeptidase-like regulatory domain-containing protein [Acidobacteriota bacterium]|nr:carboxypeptidase-like regulatory domain-containing protein [Acidobacteriota bacterium]